MEKYTGDETCVKCGSVSTDLDYSGVPKISPGLLPANEEPGREVDMLQLQCHVCGYAWNVLPLDGIVV